LLHLFERHFSLHVCARIRSSLWCFASLRLKNRTSNRVRGASYNDSGAAVGDDRDDNDDEDNHEDVVL